MIDFTAIIVLAIAAYAFLRDRHQENNTELRERIEDYTIEIEE